MSSFSTLNAASTIILPPAPDQHFISGHYIDQNNQAMASDNTYSNDIATSHSDQPSSGVGGLSSLAGRKRSRGDIFSQDDEGEDEPLEDGSTQRQSAGNPTMPSSRSSDGFGATSLHTADTDCTMVLDEALQEHKPFEPAHMKRPSVTSRKSQRVDSRTLQPDHLAQLVLPPQMRDATSEPLIDEATRALGISWTRMDYTEALLISQAAYSKWIQNHYHNLKNVSVWFENSALPGYLVSTDNAYNGQREYYIFSDDLTEARLVTTEPSQLVPRLKMLPALHLAAPGGHITAQTDRVAIARVEASAVPVEQGEWFHA